MIVQLPDGKWVRRHPEERGTLDCEESNSVRFELDPAAAATQLP